ncbi:MAG TPA: translation initiation factor IF-1 [Caulobacteraceae bacterium]|nr:translation initiation factor IF-1 [Caulobacteraceae bacterium]
MAKEEALEMEGVIIEILPGGQFRVRLESDLVILVYTAGKMRRHRIRSMVGDRVTVEMTPYDLTRGRLVFRHRDGPPAAPGARRAPYRPRR